MKRFVTAQPIACPECDHPITKVTCVERRLGRKYRYRRCERCDYKFKTSQSIVDSDLQKTGCTRNAQETVVPYIIRSVSKQQQNMRGIGSSKLSPDDIRGIRVMWQKAIYKDKQERIDIAEKFNVKERTIQNIITGKSWGYLV
tara:strand:- start:10787 stop:11215 length:429 start_codon:yes stop_codon:yes gene_type:complete